MQNMAWKLLTLAGVVGVGFLVMLQAQRGMQQAAATPTTAAKAGDGAQLADGAKPAGSPAPQSDEPAGSATLDFRSEVPKPAEPPTVVSAPAKAEGDNPFGKVEPAAASKAAGDQPPALKQTAAADNDPFGGPTPASAQSTPAPAQPAAGGPDLGGPPANADPAAKGEAKPIAATPDLTAPPQAEPGGAPAKPDSAPALLPVPDNSKPLQPKPTDAKPAPQAEPAPSLLDALDAAAPDPAKTPNQPAAPKTDAADNQPPEKKLADTKSGSEPQPFPLDAASEIPSAKAPAAPKLPAADKSAPANKEFQGDGTVDDSAPLGPQRPQLQIEKVAPQTATIGQPLVYAIVVKNIGTQAARDVSVEDRIPKGTTLSGTIPRAELTGKKLVWKVGHLAVGEERKISVRVTPFEAGDVGSVATVNFVAEAAAATRVTSPRLEFEISAKSSALLGEVVPFHFKVKNVGNGEARGVVIRTVVPEQLGHEAGNDLDYQVGRLLPGQSKETTLELKSAKVGSSLTRAVVTAEGGLTTEGKAIVEVVGSKVGITRTGPARRYLGRPALFTNSLTNESKHAVENVVIAEAVPPGVDFAEASHGGQYNDGTRTVAWRIERLGPGESHNVQVKLVPKAPGSHASSVRVTVPNGEAAEAKSELAVEGFAAVGIEMAAVEGPIDVGEKVTLRINARNKGTSPATNVFVTVDVPPEMAVVSARGPGKHAQEGSQVKFGPVASLDGRTSAACEVVLEAKKKGDSRIKISVQADQVERPLVREEAVLILSETVDAAK